MIFKCRIAVLPTDVPFKVRSCAVPTDHLRINLILAHLQHSKSYVAYTSHNPFNAWNTSFFVCLHGCAIAWALKHLLGVKIFLEEYSSQSSVDTAGVCLNVSAEMPPMVYVNKTVISLKWMIRHSTNALINVTHIMLIGRRPYQKDDPNMHRFNFRQHC